MIKIKEKKLIKKDNRYFYKQIPFSGIIFFLNKFIIKSKKKCENGIIIGDYTSDYIQNKYQLHIDKDALEYPNPKIYTYEIPRYYQGIPFTGITYKFLNGFCIEETEYRDSAGADNIDYDEEKNYSGLNSISYFISGDIKGFKRKEQDLLQEYEWYENGNIKSISIGESNPSVYVFGADLIFSEDGKISQLYLDEYFEEFETIEQKAQFKIIPSRNELIKIPLANKVSFDGEDISDDFLYEYYKRGSLNNVKNFSFYSTSLTPKGYKYLLEMPNLQEVIIRGYNPPLDVIDQLRAKNIKVSVKST